MRLTLATLFFLLLSTMAFAGPQRHRSGGGCQSVPTCRGCVVVCTNCRAVATTGTGTTLASFDVLLNLSALNQGPRKLRVDTAKLIIVGTVKETDGEVVRKTIDLSPKNWPVGSTTPEATRVRVPLGFMGKLVEVAQWPSSSLPTVSLEVTYAVRTGTTTWSALPGQTWSLTVTR